MEDVTQTGFEGHAVRETEDSVKPETSYEGKTVVVCLGNRYLRDDGIGIRVAGELRSRGLGENVLVEARQTADLSLLWRYSGASKVIIVDSMKSGAPPGAVSKCTISPNRNSIVSVPGLHSLQLTDIFDIASQTGLLTCPVTVIGVEPKNCGVGEELSTELVEAIPNVLREVAKESGSLQRNRAAPETMVSGDGRTRTDDHSSAD